MAFFLEGEEGGQEREDAQERVRLSQETLDQTLSKTQDTLQRSLKRRFMSSSPCCDAADF